MSKETRTVNEVKIWTLILNPMTGNTENGDIVAISDDKQKLVDWYNSQFAPEPYKEPGTSHFDGEPTRWHKVFKKGSPAEWFNPVGNIETLDYYRHGINSEWIEEQYLSGIKTKYLFID